MDNPIWITWEVQRRNISVSKSLGVPLYQVIVNGARWIRYVKSARETISLFRKVNPGVIFAQNPSVILSLLSVIYGRIFKVPVMIDAHNAGVFPMQDNPGVNRFVKHAVVTVNNFVLRSASLTIVTNDALAQAISTRGGTPYVLPDPIPEFRSRPRQTTLAGCFNVVFVCTYADDEPYLEVIKAGLKVPDDVRIYLTGRHQKKAREIDSLAKKNVVFTGYLEEDDFVNLLYSADVIMDLTTRPNCLVCGAYEGISLEKPLILSDTQVNRELFHKGVVYTTNSEDDIARCIRLSRENHERLAADAASLKKELQDKIDASLAGLRSRISG